jgi:TolA-binding protein
MIYSIFYPLTHCPSTKWARHFPRQLNPNRLHATLAAIIGAGAIFAASMASAQDTAACVRSVQAPGEIVVCEKQAQLRLARGIAELEQQLEQKIKGPARMQWQANQQSWRDYLDAEKRLLRATSAGRRDGMGAVLMEGAITGLLEQRHEILLHHLHNLR